MKCSVQSYFVEGVKQIIGIISTLIKYSMWIFVASNDRENKRSAKSIFRFGPVLTEVPSIDKA